MKRGIAAGALLLLAGGLFFSPELKAGNEADHVIDYLEKNVVTRTMDNGITVIMMNRGFSPTVALEISFAVGSADEQYRTEGAAHLLEHMLFKGTDRLGTRNYEKERIILRKIEAVGETIDRLKLKDPDHPRLEELGQRLARLQKEHRAYVVPSPYDRIYSEKGGVNFNASTSRDKTGYYLQLPYGQLETWAKIESERLRNPVFRQFYLERENVREERRMRYDSSGQGLLSEQFIATAFAAHPYRHPIIGWSSAIPHLTLDQVRQFYWREYVPGRMTITVVGQLDPEKTFKIISKYFSNIKERPEPLRNGIDEPKQRGERRVDVHFDSNPYLMIGWHKPTSPHRHDYVMDLLSSILGKGHSSRLYKSLVLEKKLASSVVSWNGYPAARDDNLFIIFAAPREKVTTRELERAIYRELEKAKEEISGEELERARTRMEAETVFSMDSNRGIASLLSYYQTVMGDWKYVLSYMKVLRTVTAEEVRDVAELYLRERNRTVGTLVEEKNDGEK
jgi:predicted Zn-dependent peptidase